MEEEPRLPGSLAPTDGRLPLAHIYQPSPSAMQSALTGRQPEWVLEFEPWDRKEVEPLMGWTALWSYKRVWRAPKPVIRGDCVR